VATVQLSALATAVVMLAAACGAGAQAITGFGFSLLCAPVLVQVVGPAHAVRLVNVLAVGINVLLLSSERRGADLRQAGGLLLPALVIAPATAWVVHRTGSRTLSICIGLLIVTCAVLLASGKRVRRLRGRRGLLAAGALSSAMNTASGVGGPAVAMYAVNAEWPIEMARPTMQVFFLGLNVVSFVALGAIFPSPGVLALLAGAIIAGFTVGRLLRTQLPRSAAARVVLALAVVGGLAAVARGI